MQLQWRADMFGPRVVVTGFPRRALSLRYVSRPSGEAPMSAMNFQTRLYQHVLAWGQGWQVSGLAGAAGLAGALYAAGGHDMRAPAWTLLVGVVLALAHVLVADLVGRCVRHGPFLGQSLGLSLGLSLGQSPQHAPKNAPENAPENAPDAAEAPQAGQSEHTDQDRSADREAVHPRDCVLLMALVFGAQAVFMVGVWLASTHWSVMLGALLAQAPLIGLFFARWRVVRLVGGLFPQLQPGDVALALGWGAQLVGFVTAFGLAGLPASAFTGDGPIMGPTPIIVLFGWACVVGIVVGVRNWCGYEAHRGDRDSGEANQTSGPMPGQAFAGAAEDASEAGVSPGQAGGFELGWLSLVVGGVVALIMLAVALGRVGLVFTPPVVIVGLMGMGLAMSVLTARQTEMTGEVRESLAGGALSFAMVWLAVVGVAGWLAGAPSWDGL